MIARPFLAYCLWLQAGVSTEAFLYSVSEAVPHAFGPGQGAAAIPSVSRLDKNTSGVLVVPTHPKGEAELTTQFKERTAEKTYICLVKGRTEEQGEVDAKLYVSQDAHHFRVYVSPKGKPAVTQYRRLRLLRRAQQPGEKPLGDDDLVFSLLQVKPLTGRTHQIRAHLASVGHPLVCDTKYKPKVAKRQLAWCPRMFLHASQLRVRDASGVALAAEAPLPEDLLAALGGMSDDAGARGGG